MVDLQPQYGDIPYAYPTTLSQPFWDACKEDRLIYQYFPLSGKSQFPPGPIDRYSLSSDFEWRESTGTGEVYSWTTVWRGQTGDFDVPYVVAIVDLDEGFQLLTNIIGCKAGDVAVGMRVQVEFHEVNEELTLPYFRPEM